MRNDHVILGVKDAYGRDEPVLLSRLDRTRHLYVIGMTGVGKSTLLRNLLHQDIEAGRGVAFIDPHGDDAHDILNYIPPHRVDDVVYFDPLDPECAIAFNPLFRVPKDKRPIVTSGVVGAFKAIYPDFFGPRMEYIFYAAVAALLDCENVSLLGLQRMLTDERYRLWVVRQIKDPIVRHFWEREFEPQDKRTKAEIVSPILNKVGPLFMSPPIRNILGQVRSRFNARELMDTGKIFIAKISKGALGNEAASLIGSFLVAQFQLAAMSRANVPEASRQEFFLYIDEFHSFVSDSFTSILSESRKYRLCLTISHQYIDQLKPSVAKAVFGNVGSLVVFRVGHADAETIQKTFGDSYVASAFTNLSNGEAYAKLLSSGQHVEPLPLRTLPPQGVLYRRRERIIRRSREKHTSARVTIEERIERWLRHHQS